MFVSHEYYIVHRIPKLVTPLLQTCRILFVVHGFQQNNVHYSIFTLLTVTPIMTYTFYRVCSMFVVMTSDFVYITLHSVCCY